MVLWNYAKFCDSTQTMQTRPRPCISQLTRQSHSLEMFAGVLEFLGYNLTRHSKLAGSQFLRKSVKPDGSPPFDPVLNEQCFSVRRRPLILYTSFLGSVLRPPVVIPLHTAHPHHGIDAGAATKYVAEGHIEFAIVLSLRGGDGQVVIERTADIVKPDAWVQDGRRVVGPPDSMTSTFAPDADNSAASTEPAAPAPTTMKSYRFLHAIVHFRIS